MNRKISHIAALGALVACLASPAFAQVVPAGLVPEAVMMGAGSQSPDGRRAVQQFLVGDNAAPKVIAARAAVAIRALASSGLYDDPVALLAAADNIAAAAKAALSVPRVMHAFVPDNFVLPSGARGFDFGPPDSEVMPGFEPVRPNDARIGGSGQRGLHRPGDNNLLADGIVGMQSFVTPMENGVYRIVLLTDDISDESTLLSPLGGRIIVNGKVIELGDHPSSNWMREAVLRNPDVPLEVSEAGVNGVPFSAQHGGALIIEVEITNGRLEIEMQQSAPGRFSYLVGAIATPITRDDVVGRYFDASDMVLDIDQLLDLEAEIEDALAEIVETIAPAAGPQEAEDLPEAVFEDGLSASAA